MEFNTKAKKKKSSNKKGQEETVTGTVFKSTLGYPDVNKQIMIHHQLISGKARLGS